jgi:hypothetical protein
MGLMGSVSDGQGPYVAHKVICANVSFGFQVSDKNNREGCAPLPPCALCPESS